MSKQYDFVVFGATSFVGQILTRYLAERHSGPDAPSWAIAGRSAGKLEQLRQQLGADAPEVIVADAADVSALSDLCGRTRVIVSTVGPYALYGSELVRLCAETGTDYCDLTGEVQWIRRMIDAHHETAQANGARIVHCCGFDSIPSDLGVHFLQQQAVERLGQPCSRVRMRVRAMKGTFSGGTVASLMNVIKEAGRDAELRRTLGNPHALCPPDHRRGPRQPDVKFSEYDPVARTWVAPFVMAAINTRIVHRSNALAGHPYGKDFKYDEAVMTGRDFKGRLSAMGMASGLGAFMVASALPPSRWVLERFVVPKPGEGPSPEAQESGYFDLRLFGTTATGETIATRVTGDRDPGYGSTGKMLGEAVVCLAQDIPADAEGGFWTPATLMGDQLLARLQEHAGLSFSVVDA